MIGAERQQVRETVWEITKHEMPYSIAGFRAFVERAVAALAAMEGREIIFDSDDDWESGWHAARAYYMRDETDAEMAEREKQDATYRAASEAADAREYMRLKAKFERDAGAVWDAMHKVPL